MEWTLPAFTSQPQSFTAFLACVINIHCLVTETHVWTTCSESLGRLIVVRSRVCERNNYNKQLSVEFHEIWEIIRAWTGEELIEFWTWSGIYSGYRVKYSLYETCFVKRIHGLKRTEGREWRHIDLLRTVWLQTARTRSTSLTRTHLLVGNDTVPISVWRGGGINGAVALIRRLFSTPSPRFRKIFNV